MTRVIFNGASMKQKIKAITEAATEAITDTVLDDIKDRSPVRSGLFKRSWRKSGTGTRYRLTNPQPYAGALERGRSRQAPSGVVKPAIKNIANRRYK
tara:strand:+ start:5562 stop:5852 length:291 start_codon:yes stop_codon:yes gene_type:complete